MPTLHSFSRTKIELFNLCPRCFYLDTRMGISHPPGFPFSINNAVDSLLKKEFDACREEGVVHPFVKNMGVDLIPFSHPNMDKWRSNRSGIRTTYRNYEFWGAIDDLWVDADGKLYVVDYKATASSIPVSALDKPHHQVYKRQIELYQWMFKSEGFEVSDTPYFYYCTGNSAADFFGGKIDFTVHLLPHKGEHQWIPSLLDNLISVFESDQLPESNAECKYCTYHTKRNSYEQPNRSSS